MKKSVLMGVLLVGMSCSCFAMRNSPPAVPYCPPAIDPAQQNFFWQPSVAGTRVPENKAQKKQVKAEKVERKWAEEKAVPALPTLLSKTVGQRASRPYGEPREMSNTGKKQLFKNAVESGDAALMRVLLEESADYYLAQYSALAAKHEQTELALVAQQLLRSRIAQNKQDIPDVSISFLLCLAVIRIDCQAALAFLQSGAYISAVIGNHFSREDVTKHEDGVRFSLLEQDLAELKDRVLKSSALKSNVPENNASPEQVATQQERDRFKWLESENGGSTPLRYLVHKRECALENVRPLFDTLVQELVKAGADFRTPSRYAVVPYLEEAESAAQQKPVLYVSVPYEEASAQMQEIITLAEQERDSRHIALKACPEEGGEAPAPEPEPKLSVRLISC